MDINTQNSSGMMNGMPQMPQQEKKVGPIVAVLIIVLVIIIACLYLVGQRLNTQNTEIPNPTDNSAQNQSINMNNPDETATASQSDTVDTLKSDLDNQLKNVDYSF